MKVLIISGAIPFILSFWPGLKLYRNLPAMFGSIAAVLVIFGAWDIFAVYRGHWYFDPLGTWGFKVINLPIEEVLFFVIIPFCCIFTWEAIAYMRKKIR